MASILKVDKLDPQSGTALEIGTSGDTVTVPSGVGLTLTDSTLLLPTTITSTTEVKTNKISPATGTAFALGDSGDTFTVPSGATIVNSGTATGFGITQSSFVPTAAPLIINGDMTVAQRSTSTAVTGGGYFTMDRYQTNNQGGFIGEYTQSQAADAPSGFSKSLKMDCTTSEAAGANQSVFIEQRIEAQDCMVFKLGNSDAEIMTLSFWVKATKTGTNIVRIEQEDVQRQCSQAYTVDSTDTWEKKVVTFPADTAGAGITSDNGIGLEVWFYIAAGTTYTSGTLATTWEAVSGNDANKAVGQVNNGDSTSNNFQITGVQLEVGEYTSSDIPPFRHESYGDNLQRCQRYFQTIADGAWSNNETISNGYFHVGSSFFFTLRLAVEMRANPSLTTTMGTNYVNIYRDNGSDQSDNIETYSGSTKRAMGLKADDNVSGTQGQGGQIGLNNASAFFGVNAEL